MFSSIQRRGRCQILTFLIIPLGEMLHTNQAEGTTLRILSLLREAEDDVFFPSKQIGLSCVM